MHPDSQVINWGIILDNSFFLLHSQSLYLSGSQVLWVAIYDSFSSLQLFYFSLSLIPCLSKCKSPCLASYSSNPASITKVIFLKYTSNYVFPLLWTSSWFHTTLRINTQTYIWRIRVFIIWHLSNSLNSFTPHHLTYAPAILNLS